MKNVFMQAMNEVFDLTAMLERINYHHVRGNLTDNEREELITLAREKAAPFGGLDVAAKLLELDARVTAIEQGKQESGEAAGTAPEYEVGKWYYAGNKVTYGGKTYICTAPAGSACVWSPADYPAYWDEV